MTHLFEPLKIKDVTLRNRIGVSPMCQYSYTDGFSNDWQLVHLGTRAAGGAGLVIAEATAVEPRGRITPYDVGIWSDAHIEPLARVAHFIKEQGAVAGIQIAHAGRKACTGKPWLGGKPLAQSDPLWWQVSWSQPDPVQRGTPDPRQALEISEIHEIQAAFVRAAERSLQAGFEWLEIHGGARLPAAFLLFPAFQPAYRPVRWDVREPSPLPGGDGTEGARSLA